MAELRIVSVNLGHAEPVDDGGDRYLTGIRKRAATGRVFVGRDGLRDDTICNREFHGGADQAVYVYGAGDYAWWSRRLGRELAPGTFGENLTIDNLPADLRAGDRLQAADVILEATAPRIPCNTLAARMGDRKFGLAFRRAERPGFYCRVIATGELGAGDPVTHLPTDAATVSMLDLFRLNYELRPSADALRRAVAAPIAERMRAAFAEKLAAAG